MKNCALLYLGYLKLGFELRRVNEKYVMNRGAEDREGKERKQDKMKARWQGKDVQYRKKNLKSSFSDLSEVIKQVTSG
jgi:hypothetical protein